MAMILIALAQCTTHLTIQLCCSVFSYSPIEHFRHLFVERSDSSVTVANADELYRTFHRNNVGLY